MNFILTLLFTTSVCAFGAGLFNAPADWIDLELDNPDPKQIARAPTERVDTSIAR
jgi:hypothetical protein